MGMAGFWVIFESPHKYRAQYPYELRPWWTIPHRTIYVHCQRSVPKQEVVFRLSVLRSG